VFSARTTGAVRGVVQEKQERSRTIGIERGMGFRFFRWPANCLIRAFSIGDILQGDWQEGKVAGRRNVASVYKFRFQAG
jgi:hypothetical protein